MQEYEKWKIVGDDGCELVQCMFEEGRVIARAGASSSFMTLPVGGAETPITMPKEHAEALASILKNSTVPGFRKAKVIRA
ncbi:hypothetical protein LJR071_004166 [Pseudomonas sp. LjRoot71]|uniref:hypothetical protein n=1 Tax=Pseudomonas sp. LjRoot71 TaxID=3342336 RepID=UPI003ECC2D21